jgi:hypothetical protein
MEQSLLKTNFLGRDGFLWWIGQVATEGSQQKQLDKEGWGNRRKVRIMGYHPSNEQDLSNDDLPWAQVLLSTSDGSGAGNYATSIKISPGDCVFGFFMDGDNAQLPVIIGVFGKTSEGASAEEFKLPFEPFTGYTSKIKNDGSKVSKDQTNENTQGSQESPVSLPPQVANNLRSQSANNFRSQSANNLRPQVAANSNRKIAYSSATGDTIQLGTTMPGSKIDKIATEIENAIKFLEDLKSFPNLAQEFIDAQVEKLCQEISKKIQGITTEIVGSSVNGTYEKLIPALEKGSKSIYTTTFEATFASTQSISQAQLAGAKAQAATIEPVNQLQKLIPCLINSIISELGALIEDMVCALLKNVANVVSCIIDQFVSGILNAIIDLITTGLSAILGILGVLLSFSNFNLLDTVKNLVEGLLGISLSLNCGEEPENPNDMVKKWKIGYGPVQSSSFDVNDILNLANTAKAIADGSQSPLSPLESIVGPLDFLSPNISIPDFNSALSNCFGGKPTVCNPPIINIFGGGGSGASALPIFGSIVGEGNNRSGSIIGAIIKSSGFGYKYPPFVSISDNCGRGYGAVAQSFIKNGQVTAIVINSDGEGYPVGNQPVPNDIVDTGRGAGGAGAGGAGTGVGGGNITIIEVIIENPGYNYTPGDIVTDNFKNKYDVVIDDGSISSITPINITDITDRPVLRVISNTGAGAILKPVFGFAQAYQGEVKQVIDCVK